MAMGLVADNERVFPEYAQLKENIQSTTRYSEGNQISSQASPAATRKARTQLWELQGLTWCPSAPMGLTILCWSCSLWKSKTKNARFKDFVEEVRNCVDIIRVDSLNRWRASITITTFFWRKVIGIMVASLGDWQSICFSTILEKWKNYADLIHQRSFSQTTTSEGMKHLTSFPSHESLRLFFFPPIGSTEGEGDHFW